MRVEPVTGRVTGGPLEPVYVYEAPVRLWHWATVLCIVVLSGTGYLIGSPPPAIGGEAYESFFFGWIRMIHEVAGYLLVVAFLVRVYWALVGNRTARTIFYMPVWRAEWWRGFFRQMGYYLFLRKESDLWVGHNPAAQFAMFLMFMLGLILMIVTGMALYAEQWGWGVGYMAWFGWVFTLLGDPQWVRTLHHLGMWYLLLFALIHVYIVFREDIMSGETIISTMVNGIRMWKREPRT
jgi:Ni/Fe-hydrogenase 1 B-type cytochrome subunit